MQASLEAETRAKTEALTIKKIEKIETEINELEIALDQPNKANAEAHKTINNQALPDPVQGRGDQL